ncbi:hypothetical protein B0H16DRAFT_1738789 [Mycena metata]|uniref:Uncharacterized protein n=1 Tax=Mycena metata TaxID=1033252 RepID=A0AAD7MJJ9_9AGAR|nr:hypothetical protein B0H16DRAFT_1738789 [Mycena metata]
MTGGRDDSAPGRLPVEGHSAGGRLAEGRSEVNRDGYQPSRGGSPRRADDERLDATLDAERGPGGAGIGVGEQYVHRAEQQHQPVVGGGAVNARAHVEERPVENGQGGANPPIQHLNYGGPFLQPVPNNQPPQNGAPPPVNNGHVNQGNPFLQPMPNDGAPRNDTPPPAYLPPFVGNLYDDFEERDEQPRFGGRHKPPPKSKKTLKASLKISGLNIKGNGDDKWYRVWQEMRETRTAVMIVGEAHMDDALKSQMNTLFARQLRVEFTPDPTAPRVRAGLAIVLNKSLVLTEGVKTWEIVPGRALLLEMLNVDGKKPLSILGVYALNPPGENAEFWRTILT